MDKLTLIKALLCEVEDQTPEPARIVASRKVIIRSRDAGVVYGELVSIDGPNITVTNGRQLWKWKAAKGHTLVDVAEYGVDAKGCKFSPASATITVFNACALLDVSGAAVKTIEAA